MVSAVLKAIAEPEMLWTVAEIRTRPSPVPMEAGIYGWYFDELPADFDASLCVRSGNRTLLYVGIAPAHAGSRSHLRRRLRQHYRNNGSSTLRRTLAALLADRLALTPGISARGRLRLGDAGETALSDWIAEHAAVTWMATPEPWLAERELLAQLNLPLNLMHNGSHPFASELAAARATARRLAASPLPEL